MGSPVPANHLLHLEHRDAAAHAHCHADSGADSGAHRRSNANPGADRRPHAHAGADRFACGARAFAHLLRVGRAADPGVLPPEARFSPRAQPEALAPKLTARP